MIKISNKKLTKIVPTVVCVLFIDKVFIDGSCGSETVAGSK